MNEERWESEGGAPAPEERSSPLVRATNLARWYGEVIALNDVTVEFSPGITGVLGPNGSGKTTFLGLVVGILRPSAGVIRVFDEDPWNNPAVQRRIGYVPDGEPPWKERTVLHAVRHGVELTGRSRKEAEEAAFRALEEVGLLSEAERKVRVLSRGMQQRLKLALGLAGSPDLLVLDEPLSGTDPPTRKDLIRKIRSLGESGKSILVSTHILPDVEALTQRIALLARGRLLAYGEVGEIRNLLERYPRTVRVGTLRPREVGQALWGLDSVVQIHREEGGVVVRISSPAAFFQDLQEIVVSKNLPVTSVVTLDENVESVFRYIVGEER